MNTKSDYQTGAATLMVILSQFLFLFLQSAVAMQPVVQEQPKLKATAVPGLIAKIKDGNQQEIFQAMNDLHRVEPISATAPAIPILTKLVQRAPDCYIQQMAAETLGYLPPTDSSIQTLGKALNDQDRDLRLAAAGAIPRNEKYLPQIIAGLHHPDWEVRHAILAKFQVGGAVSEQVIALLIAALSDSNQCVRSNAALALEHVGKDAKQAGPALVRRLRLEPDGLTRGFAARALLQTGGVSQADVPILIECLRNDKSQDPTGDSSEGARYSSAQVIGRLGREAKLAVPSLIYATEHDKSELVRGYSVEALGCIGPAAQQAIPAIIHFLKNRSADNYRYEAPEALGKIARADNQTVIAALIDALQDRNDGVQSSSIKALARLGNRSPAVVEALKRIRCASGSQVQKDLIAAMRQLSVPANDAIPVASNSAS